MLFIGVANATGLCFGQVRAFVPELGAVDQPLDIRPLVEVDNTCDIDRIRLVETGSGDDVRVRVDDERQTQEVVPLQPLLPDHGYEVHVDLVLGGDRVLDFRTGSANAATLGTVQVELTPTLEDCFLLEDGSQSVVWVLDGRVLDRPPGTLVGPPSQWVLDPDEGLRTTVFVNPAIEGDPLCMEVWRRSASGESAFENVCVPAPTVDPAVCQSDTPLVREPTTPCACQAPSASFTTAWWARRR